VGYSFLLALLLNVTVGSILLVKESEFELLLGNLGDATELPCELARFLLLVFPYLKGPNFYTLFAYLKF